MLLVAVILMPALSVRADADELSITNGRLKLFYPDDCLGVLRHWETIKRTYSGFYSGEELDEFERKCRFRGIGDFYDDRGVGRS